MSEQPKETHQQKAEYRTALREFACTTLLNQVLQASKAMMLVNPETDQPDEQFQVDLRADIQTVLGFATISLGMDYFNQRQNGTENSAELFKELYETYENELHTYFQEYLIAVDSDIPAFVTEMILSEVFCLYGEIFEDMTEDQYEDVFDTYEEFLNILADTIALDEGVNSDDVEIEIIYDEEGEDDETDSEEDTDQDSKD